MFLWTAEDRRWWNRKGVYMVDADEMETKYKISAYFRIVLNMGKVQT